MLKMTWTAEKSALLETLFHTANGTLGVRFSPEEGETAGGVRGTYLAGVYEDTSIAYGEKLYGFPEVKQTLCCLPDAQTVHITVDGKAFSQFDGNVTDRVMAWQEGAAVKTCRLKTEKGDLSLSVRRVVPLDMGGLFAMEIRLKSETFSGSVTASSCLNGDVANAAAADDPRVAAEALKCLQVTEVSPRGEGAFMQARTLLSGLRIAVSVAHRANAPGAWTFEKTACRESFAWQLTPGQEARLVKYAFYADSRRFPSPEAASQERLLKALETGFEGLCAHQNRAWRALKEKSFASVMGDEALQEAFLADQWALSESVGTDGIFSVAAKGLSGEGYEGHAFWDAEMYVFPFVLWTAPERARGMLDYRVALLDKAKEHARLLGLEKGALYPWRTITGSECSGYFPSGSAQVHINGDIAYAFLQYYYVTGDLKYMAEKGARLLVETARAWLEIGHMEADGFRIDCVTGPDEYTCLVNNNYYTNAVAAYHLRGTARLLEDLRNRGLARQVISDTGVTPEEAEQFRYTGEHMYYPPEKDGITPQDDSFLMKKKWDFHALPRDQFPLLLHYHPLKLYRYQVCKQADTVLAHLLFPELASEEVRRKSLAYYDAITTHDSSLSKAVFAMEAARLGDGDAAMEAFLDAAFTDVRDSHRNTKDGLHTASLGGAYLAVLLGFAGVRATDKGLEASPILPAGLEGYRLPIHYRGRELLLTAEKEKTSLKLVSGDKVAVKWYGEEHSLAPSEEMIYPGK